MHHTVVYLQCKCLEKKMIGDERRVGRGMERKGKLACQHTASSINTSNSQLYQLNTSTHLSSETLLMDSLGEASDSLFFPAAQSLSLALSDQRPQFTLSS